MSGFKNILRCEAFREARDLGYKADAPSGMDDDAALILAQLARQQAEERCLSATVASEDADALARVYFKADVNEQILSDFEGFF